MPAVNRDWLALTTESALEPELPICDPHHHLWEQPGNTYRSAELLADAAGGHRIVQTVFVECMAGYTPGAPPELAPVGETAFVVGEAEDAAASPTRVAAGIVGFADLLLGERVEAVLEAHLRASPDRFKGIRHAAGWHASDAVRNSHTNPPEGLLLDARFRAGFARLAPLGLSFDAWLYHPQLCELADLARAFESTPIVLDHVGGPLGIGPYADQRAEVFEGWKKAIAELAQCPNVVCKVGGLQMPLNGFGWHHWERPPSSLELAASTAPYYLHCIEQFGPARCMFESNFPVDKVSCSYTVLWNSFKRLSADLEPEERAALFHDTAARVYRLSAP